MPAVITAIYTVPAHDVLLLQDVEYRYYGSNGGEAQFTLYFGTDIIKTFFCSNTETKDWHGHLVARAGENVAVIGPNPEWVVSFHGMVLLGP